VGPTAWNRPCAYTHGPATNSVPQPALVMRWDLMGSRAREQLSVVQKPRDAIAYNYTDIWPGAKGSNVSYCAL